MMQCVYYVLWIWPQANVLTKCKWLRENKDGQMRKHVHKERSSESYTARVTTSEVYGYMQNPQ